MAEFIQFRIKPDSKKKIQAIANFEGVTITSMLQEFIDQKIADHSQVSSKVKTSD